MKKNEPSRKNRVYRACPKGTVATLNTLGVSTRLSGWHVRSGWLENFGPKAFIQPGGRVDWQGGLYALQTQLGMSVHAGEKTALEMPGLTHYVPGGNMRVMLISDHAEQLPTWFRKRDWGVIGSTTVV